MEIYELDNNRYRVTLQSGEIFKGCSCGYSDKIPICDDAHRSINERYSSCYKSFKIGPFEEETSIIVHSSNWIVPKDKDE